MTADTVVVAIAQIDSRADMEANWEQAERLCRRAAKLGAEVVTLPENMLYEGPDMFCKQDVEGVWKPRLASLARELGVAIVGGSLREPTPDAADPKSYNTVLALDSEGVERARYRKIHLFEVDLPDGTCHKESDYLCPGSEPVVCDLPPLGCVGLSICYDLRFPELYRELVKRGAKTLFVPSSFTMETGRDHWLALLKARAIENQCFVVAANQVGQKGRKVRKYGRSVIIDPWGTELARCPDKPSICLAELDFEVLEEARRGLPALEHMRLI